MDNALLLNELEDYLAEFAMRSPFIADMLEAIQHPWILEEPISPPPPVSSRVIYQRNEANLILSIKMSQVENGNDKESSCSAPEPAEKSAVCAICLEECGCGIVTRTPCGHLYHANCIVQWLQ